MSWRFNCVRFVQIWYAQWPIRMLGETACFHKNTIEIVFHVVVAAFGRTFRGHSKRNVIPIGETALLYQIEQLSFFARWPIRARKHFDIIMDDDVGMCVGMCLRFGATRKTFQAAEMFGRRTLGARNEWLVQWASTNGTINRTVFVTCVNGGAIHGCRRRNRTTLINANRTNERLVKVAGVCTRIQKKHLDNWWPETLWLYHVRWVCSCVSVHNVSEMGNVLPFGNCKSAASSSTISTGACDILIRFGRLPMKNVHVKL